jgi:hypothetical protein
LYRKDARGIYDYNLALEAAHEAVKHIAVGGSVPISSSPLWRSFLESADQNRRDRSRTLGVVVASYFGVPMTRLTTMCKDTP